MQIRDLSTDLGWHKYGISSDDVVLQALGCQPSEVCPVAVVAPTWKPEMFSGHDVEIDTLHVGFVDTYRVHASNSDFTMIRSGVGAPVTGDATLALVAAGCQYILFVGAVGGLKSDQHVGDLLVPTCSVSGDGFSTYLNGNPSIDHSSFLQIVEPDPICLEVVQTHARSAAREGNIVCHTGAVYSIDTILAQFSHIQWMRQQFDAVGIEMETSSVFAVARKYGLPAAALLAFSDISATNKSLMGGRTQDEILHYRTVRRTVVASTVLRVVHTMNDFVSRKQTRTT